MVSGKRIFGEDESLPQKRQEKKRWEWRDSNPHGRQAAGFLNQCVYQFHHTPTKLQLRLRKEPLLFLGALLAPS